MRDFDHTIMPAEGANRMTLLGQTALRVYSSSMPDQLSVVMFPADEPPGYVSAGTRLIREQVEELRDQLTTYLGDDVRYTGEEVGNAQASEFEVGFSAGRIVGFSAGRVEGFDSGHEAGYELGKDRGMECVG